MKEIFSPLPFCDTDLSDEEIEKYNSEYFQPGEFLLHFAAKVPTENVPICQMVRKAMRNRKKDLTIINIINSTGLESEFFSNQLVFGIALELLSTEYPNLAGILILQHQITNISLLGFALKKTPL